MNTADRNKRDEVDADPVPRGDMETTLHTPAESAESSKDVVDANSGGISIFKKTAASTSPPSAPPTTSRTPNPGEENETLKKKIEIVQHILSSSLPARAYESILASCRSAATTPPQQAPTKTTATDSVNNSRSMDECYNFKHPFRGTAIIINNEKFLDPERDRKGAKKDGDVLKKSLAQLDFSVTLKENLKAKEIVKLVEDEATADHSQDDCFLFVIMTHGDKDAVCGTDSKPVSIDDITGPFKTKNTLNGKPKIFIFQACRGRKLVESVQADGGDAVDADTAEEVPMTRIPVEADFLYAFSTLPDHFSWRNTTDGSWYIQQLAKLLDQDAEKMSFVDLLTKLNRIVIVSHSSNTGEGKKTNDRQQMGIFVSTLTKTIIFTPKF